MVEFVKFVGKLNYKLLQIFVTKSNDSFCFYKIRNPKSMINGHKCLICFIITNLQFRSLLMKSENIFRKS